MRMGDFAIRMCIAYQYRYRRRRAYRSVNVRGRRDIFGL